MEQRAGARHLGDIVQGGREGQARGVGLWVFGVAGGVCGGFALEGEAERGGIEGALGGFGGAIDGKCDVVGWVVVFVLGRAVSAVCRGCDNGARLTRRCLYVLSSPKRCSTRKISRLSDRLAGRGTMRRWMEREGSWAAALRTDMVVVGCGGDFIESSNPPTMQQKSEVKVGQPKLPKRIAILGSGAITWEPFTNRREDGHARCREVNRGGKCLIW